MRNFILYTLIIFFTQCYGIKDENNEVTIVFENNSSELSFSSKARLDSLGKEMAKNNLQFEVYGYTHPSENNRHELAFNRANKVRTYLVDNYHLDGPEEINEEVPGPNLGQNNFEAPENYIYRKVKVLLSKHKHLKF